MRTILISTGTAILGVVLTVLISPRQQGIAADLLRNPSLLADDQVAEYWRLTNSVNLAQIALDRTPEAQRVKEAFDRRNQLLQNLGRICETRKLSLTSATQDQATKLGVQAETPICSKK